MAVVLTCCAVACYSAATTPRILQGSPPYQPCTDGGPICYGQCVEHLSGGMACEAPLAAPTAWARARDAGSDGGP